MASFTYKAIDHNGETENGYLIAENIDEAQNELKNRKLIPLKLKMYFNLLLIMPFEIFSIFAFAA